LIGDTTYTKNCHVSCTRFKTTFRQRLFVHISWYFTKRLLIWLQVRIGISLDGTDTIAWHYNDTAKPQITAATFQISPSCTELHRSLPQ